MSVKPDDIPQNIWDKAYDTVEECTFEMHPADFLEMVRHVSRAIMDAVEGEREACAGLADVYAEVNWQECSDNILLDPVLSNRGARPLTKQDWDKAEDMAVNSTIHSSMYHAAQNIAASIRSRQSKDG